jgi:hypothetical protein
MSSIPFVTRFSRTATLERPVEKHADRLALQVFRYALLTVVGPAAVGFGLAALLPS